MKKVKIITTSGCDLSYEETEKLGVTMISDWVIFGEEQYRNNLDITPEEFYQRLASEEALPTSSHPSPAQFIDAFQSAADADEIVCIVVSSKLSGTYNTACFTAEQMIEDGFEPKIHVFDSLQISFGMALQVFEAVRMSENGACAEQIIDRLNELHQNVGVFFVMNTLEYARKGGRIGAITALAADSLGVKPLLMFHDGIVNDLSLNRTLKSGIKSIYKKFCTLADTNEKVFIFHAGNLHGAELLKSMIQEEFPSVTPSIRWVGPVVGIYTGNGCVGIAFCKKDS